MQFTPNGKIGKAVEKSTAPESDTKVFVPKPHKKKDELETDLILGPVPSWSFSSLSKYEQCPRSVAFSRIDKIYEPTSPVRLTNSPVGLKPYAKPIPRVRLLARKIGSSTHTGRY